MNPYTETAQRLGLEEQKVLNEFLDSGCRYCELRNRQHPGAIRWKEADRFWAWFGCVWDSKDTEVLKHVQKTSKVKDKIRYGKKLYRQAHDPALLSEQIYPTAKQIKLIETEIKHKENGN